MNDAQKLIAEVLQARFPFVKDLDAVAAEIDKALGGLTRETVREQVPYGDSTSGVMPTAWKKPQIMRTRWVSVGWSEVQS